MIRIWVGWNVHCREVEGRSRSVEEASGRDEFFFRELKAGILKLQDLRTSEVGTKLDRHTGEIGGRFWSTENLSTHLRRDPLTQRSMSSGPKKKLLDLRCCKFVIVPNSKVCRCRGPLGVGDDFGSAFFLGDIMHGPTCIGGIVRNASNMLEFLVDFGFLNNSDSAKIQTSRRGWNLEHKRRRLLNDGRQR